MKHVYKVLPIYLMVLGFVYPGCKPLSTQPVDNKEENKALILRVIEVMDQRDWGTFAELHTPNFIDHSPGEPKPQTREELVQSFRELYASFPDFRQTIEDIIAEGDKVVTRFTLRGTHKGNFLGIPATDKEITQTDIVIFRIAGGKIAEAWEECDMMSVMQQLGAIPPIEEAGKE